MAALCWWSSDFKTLILNDLCVEISSSVGPREPENKDDRDTTTFLLIFCVFQILCSVLYDCNLTLMADRSAGYQQVCCSFSNTSANMRWTPAPVFIHCCHISQSWWWMIASWLCDAASCLFPLSAVNPSHVSERAVLIKSMWESFIHD